MSTDETTHEFILDPLTAVPPEEAEKFARLSSESESGSREKKSRKKQDSEEEKPEVLVRHLDKNQIIDTILDDTGTHFVRFDRQNGDIQVKDKVYIGEKESIPLSPRLSFFTTGLALLPSEVGETGETVTLLDDLESFFSHYVDASPEFLRIAAYYVLLTYLYERCEVLPYLRVIGDFGTGKSRCLKVIGSVCYNAIMTNGSTSMASIFRMIDKFHGTFIFDEADLSTSEATDGIMKIINSGFMHGSPILRADGDKFEPRAYEVFGPKILGGREEFEDQATESRCIAEYLQATSRKDIPRNLDETFKETSLALRNRLLAFRYATFDGFLPSTSFVDGLDPRTNQIANPLLSVVDAYGRPGDRDMIVAHLIARNDRIKQNRYLSIEGQVFRAILALKGKYEFILYSQIVENMGFFEGTYSLLKQKKLGEILRRYGMTTKRRSGGYGIEVAENLPQLNKVSHTFGFDEKRSSTT